MLIGQAEPDSCSLDSPTLLLHSVAQGSCQSGVWLLGLLSELCWLSRNESLKARERGLLKKWFSLAPSAL